MAGDEDDILFAVSDRSGLVSWEQNMDTSQEFGRELHQKAMDFRDIDGIMRYA